MSKKKEKIVACLDIGTTKVVCLIARIEGEKIDILGYGYRRSEGIIAGAIVDMKLAQKSISEAVYNAEKMAGFNIDRLVVALSAAQTHSQKKLVKSKIASDMVKNVDITNLTHNLRQNYRQNNREIIHLIALQYKIDNSSPVQNPRYMIGEILSARFHIISAALTTTRNIESCLNKCQISVYNYICKPYSSALAALNEGDFQLETLVINIGGNNASYCIILANKLVHTGNFSMGGNHITKDIAAVLNINFRTAQNIKHLNNSLILNPIEEREIINTKASDFDVIDFSKTAKKDLKEIIIARLEEILEGVRLDIVKSGYNILSINNIVVGGGEANLVGVEGVVSNIFKKPAKVGIPQGINNLPESFSNPTFFCVLGMLIFMKNIYLKENINYSFESKGGFFRKWLEKLMTI